MAAVRTQTAPDWTRDMKGKLVKMTLTMVMLMIGILMIVPFLWTISASLKQERDIFSFPISLLPDNPTLDAYELVLGLNEERALTVSMTRAYINRCTRSTGDRHAGRLCVCSITLPRQRNAVLDLFGDDDRPDTGAHRTALYDCELDGHL